MGGQWTLTIPNEKALSLVTQPAGRVLHLGPINLLALDAPTLLTDWDIYNVRLPLNVSAKLKVAEAAVVTITATLKIGGDVVWSQSVEVAAVTNALNEAVANAVMSADLQNALILARGRSLTLDVFAQVNKETETIFITLNFLREAGGSAEVPSTPQGTVLYTARELTGHRRL